MEVSGPTTTHHCFCGLMIKKWKIVPREDIDINIIPFFWKSIRGDYGLDGTK